MKPLSQLIRQPGKSLLGILFVSLGVASLMICLLQYISVETTMTALDHLYSTVALPNRWYDDAELNASLSEWTEQVIQEYPDTIILDSRPGLASAYISELNPDLSVQHEDMRINGYSPGDYDAGSIIPFPENTPYCTSVLEVTILELADWYGPLLDPETGEYQFAVVGTFLRCTIDQVHSLNSSYQDPTGFTLDIGMKGKTIPELESQGYGIGMRLMVRGNNYLDWDYCTREYMRYKSQGEMVVPVTSMEDITWYDTPRAGTGVLYYVGEYRYGNQSFKLTEIDCAHLRCIQIENPETTVLTGTAQEYFAANAQWAAYLEQSEISNHAFPIIGVDKLGYIGQFAQETARIVQGRDFTQEELEAGARVCILAESLANTHGLKIGDTITAQYYDIDPTLTADQRIGSGYGTTEPTAYPFTENTAFVGQPETYTIVGFYRAPEWQNYRKDIFSFTPNVIFVPKASVTGPMDYGDRAFFRTIVLENGKMQDFMQLASDAGFDGIFQCYDQGYSLVIGSYQSFRDSTQKAALLGSLIYIVISLLYLLLFPGQQRKVLRTMESLGAPRRHRVGHVLLSSLGLLVPAAALGTVLAVIFWDKLTGMLMDYAQVSIPLEMNVSGLVCVAGLQLAIMMAFVAAISLVVSQNQKL